MYDILAHHPGMTSRSDVAQKLKRLRERTQLSVREVAEAIGRPASTYATYEDRFKKPYLPVDLVQQLIPIFAPHGVTSQELLALAGVAKGDGHLGVDRPERPYKEGIPELDVRAGMGGGGESLLAYAPDANGESWPEDAVTGLWDLPLVYLQYELRVRPKAARIIEVQGDSMEPVLFSGDRVMVNLQDRVPTPPGIFAVWDGFGVVVKRLELIPNSDPPTVVISSDNPQHGRYERTADEVNVIGRVVWFARRM